MDDPDYLAPYRRAAERYGAGFHATLWGSPETQSLRFEVIRRHTELDGTMIADLGCGPGDLASWLREHGVTYRGFLGIDAVAPQIDAATARDLPDATFEVRDLLRDELDLAERGVDWAIVSGTLNTMTDDDARGLIARAFDGVTTGVAFNFLGDRPHAKWAGRDLGPARRFSTAGWLEWALDRTSRVILDQHYLDGHDVTIVMVREDAPTAAG